MATSVRTRRAVPRARQRTSPAGALSAGWSRGGVLAALVVALLGVGVASIAIGVTRIPLAEAWSALTNFSGTDNELFVRELRGPRTLTGIAVGAALGCAGALIQGLTRNPLADPWILGIQAGASFAVVLGIFALGITAATDYAWLALAGAALTWLVVFVIGSSGGSRATPLNITLAGAAVSALLIALISAVIVLDAQTLDQFRFWVVGSLADRSVSVLLDLLPFLLAGLAIAVLSGKALNGLSLGDDVARALGQRVVLSQVAIAVAVVLLAGAAVALAGPIGFVGLTVPHVARAIVGPDYRWIVPYSAVLGAILLLGADIVGRLIAPPSEVQVGIVMAVIGTPVFIALVRRRRLVDL